MEETTHRKVLFRIRLFNNELWLFSPSSSPLDRPWNRTEQIRERGARRGRGGAQGEDRALSQAREHAVLQVGHRDHAL